MNRENGALTLGANVCLCLWYKITTLIQSEEAARQYSQCLKEMYQSVCDTDNSIIYNWWIHFWGVNTTKYPNAALDHLDHLLHDSIDRKQSMLTILLPVIILTLSEPRVRMNFSSRRCIPNGQNRSMHESTIFSMVSLKTKGKI